jgi:hypothetical protein
MHQDRIRSGNANEHGATAPFLQHLQGDATG